MVIILAF